jgi:hypothetical protein
VDGKKGYAESAFHDACHTSSGTTVDIASLGMHGSAGGKFMVGVVAFTCIEIAQENIPYGSRPQIPGVPSEEINSSYYFWFRLTNFSEPAGI